MNHGAEDDGHGEPKERQVPPPTSLQRDWKLCIDVFPNVKILSKFYLVLSLLMSFGNVLRFMFRLAKKDECPMLAFLAARVQKLEKPWPWKWWKPKGKRRTRVCPKRFLRRKWWDRFSLFEWRCHICTLTWLICSMPAVQGSKPPYFFSNSSKSDIWEERFV